MKILMRFIYESLLILLLISCGNNNSNTVTILNNPALLSTARSLPTQGTLEVTKEGYVYLKVSNDYLNVLYPILIQHAEEKDTPCIMPAKSSVGSHVTVFYAGQLSPEQIQSLPIGNTFNFQIKEIEMVNKTKYWHNQPEKVIWYVLLIDSPDLSSRLKSLITLRHFRSFHISIARENFDTNGFCIKPHPSY
ncbi:hypothetical protein Lsai_1805 [Legionella sainthelensi]|uniref:Uncharacterized protein n=1 Tax=Legionella sainthelensi TaxID=28087 RepID=A0A0W0YJX2_9GAMM|nr:hypothetical protein [Legionella sainthelensi]KTD57201.1 hypothetical protein Lsai_1805 [Legionella sainthelensi]VEH37516.1 Uncharacterised protein [Legionella sainthelensi]